MNTIDLLPGDQLLTTREVATLAGINRHTVPGWTQARGIRTIRTPGGQPRWRASQVKPAAARYQAARLAAPLGITSPAARRLPGAPR